MDTKFKLINTAQKKSNDLLQIVENFKVIAKIANEDHIKLMEGATQVLAGLKAMITAGQPLTKAGMSPASLAGVIAGLQVVTSALPKITDPQKKQRALSILNDLTVGQNMSLGSATALANVAEKNPKLDDLRKAFDQYAQSGQPNPGLAQMLGQLQVLVDQAMRASTQPAAGTAGAQKTPMPAVASGTVATVGQNR
jgi:hypothetical protein